MPVKYLPNPWEGVIEAGRASTESFINALRWAQQRKREKRQMDIEDALRQAQSEYYRARAEEARMPPTQKSAHTPHYTQQVLGELMTGSPYSPMGIPMETLTDKEDYLNYATKKFGPGWEADIPQALDIIGKKFPEVLPQVGPPTPILAPQKTPTKPKQEVTGPSEPLEGPPSPGRGKFEPKGEHYQKQEWRDALSKTENGKIILNIIDMDIPLEKKNKAIQQIRSGKEVRVVNPKGMHGTISVNELLEALEQGYELE